MSLGFPPPPTKAVIRSHRYLFLNREHRYSTTCYFSHVWRVPVSRDGVAISVLSHLDSFLV